MGNRAHMRGPDETIWNISDTTLTKIAKMSADYGNDLPIAIHSPINYTISTGVRIQGLHSNLQMITEQLLHLIKNLQQLL
jgi:hypothetical protein